LGESAKAVPETTNNDRASAANVFIASLFELKNRSTKNTGEFANHPGAKGNGHVLLSRQLSVNIL
jgi:hypothetical protein